MPAILNRDARCKVCARLIGLVLRTWHADKRTATLEFFHSNRRIRACRKTVAWKTAEGWERKGEI